MLEEFKEFLMEYKVAGLAIAFIIGAASTDLIKSLVNNIIMPFVGALVPGGDWQTATLALGSIKIGWGVFLSTLINFIIIAFVVFVISKVVLKEEKVSKK